ncbi:MAG: hypothetical protein ACTSW1_02035 [Candidatus Hodarchaeales archaeon]
MTGTTYYRSYCPACGTKCSFIVVEEAIIRCPKCNEIVGTRVNKDLDVTILCGWNAEFKKKRD